MQRAQFRGGDVPSRWIARSHLLTLYRRWVTAGDSITLVSSSARGAAPRSSKRRTPSEQEGRKVDLHFVQQSGAQALLDDIRAAGDRDLLVARGCTSLRDGGVDSLGDERVRRPALLRHRLARVVGQSSDIVRSSISLVIVPPAHRGHL